MKIGEVTEFIMTCVWNGYGNYRDFNGVFALLKSNHTAHTLHYGVAAVGNTSPDCSSLSLGSELYSDSEHRVYTCRTTITYTLAQDQFPHCLFITVEF